MYIKILLDSLYHEKLPPVYVVQIERKFNFIEDQE